MRTLKTEGIIIKRRNIGEADRLITAYTKRFGKIQLKAVGVRKIQSRRSPHIELLNLSTFHLHIGKGIPIVTEVESVEDFSDIKQDLTKTGFAYHICELIDGLCPENQENRAVFNLLLSTLKRLSGDYEIAPIIHEFEIELLTILGFWSKARSSENVDTHYIIENILERRLKSKRLLSKLH